MAAAADFYWDNYDSTTDTTGDGLWGNAANWATTAAGDVNPSTAPGINDDLFFSASTLRTQTLDPAAEPPTVGVRVALVDVRSARSLTFSGSDRVEIRSQAPETASRVLTLGIGGINVLAGAGQVSIGSGVNTGTPIRMTGAQSWINNSSNTLSIGNSVAFINDLGAQTLEVGGSGNISIGAEIRNANSTGSTSSVLSLTKTGAGTLTLSSSSNTYTGLTTITGGTLTMNKGNNSNSIVGNVLINGGTLRWGSNSNQVNNTSAIQMTSGAINMNSRTDTIGSLNISGGTVTFGNNATLISSDLTLTGGSISAATGVTFTTGDALISGGTGTSGGGRITTGASTYTAGNLVIDSTAKVSYITISSNATFTVESLRMTGTADTNHTLDGTSLGGNILMGANHATNVTKLVIGSGGLSMTNQTIQVNRHDSTAAGASIVLGGDFTGSGVNAIGVATSGGSINTKSTIDLGSSNRTFNITDGTTTFSSAIIGDGGGITKTGDGTLTLALTTGAALTEGNERNTYTGETVVNGGQLNVSTALYNTSAVRVSNATLALDPLQSNLINDDAAIYLAAGAVLKMGGNETLGALSVNGSVILDLSLGTSLIGFANSSAEDWSGGLLTILGWDGDVNGGGAEQVVFADGSSGLGSRIDQIQFSQADGLYTARMLDSGEIVPGDLIPEASSAALVFLGGAGVLLRRKRRSA